MASILLQGEPGSGKTTMAALTAVHKPVHFLDIDRKIGAMANLREAIDKKELTYWELDEPLTEEPLDKRAAAFATNAKPLIQPKGWVKFAGMVSRLEKEPESKSAGTWVLDSATRLGDHLKKLVIYQDPRGHSTLNDRNWGSYLGMWTETLSILIDTAKSQGKDLIVTVHERTSEIPGENSRVLKTTDKEGISRREYTGMMDIRIVASLEGQTGITIGAHFEEVYWLHVVMDEKTDMPIWRCRVLPDGRRALRTSHKVSKAEFSPDFREIWK